MKRNMKFILAAVIVIAVTFGGMYAYTWHTTNNSGKILANIKIDNQDVGGMSISEAEELINKRASELKDEKITLKAGSKSFNTTGKDASITCDKEDVSNAVKDAYNIGREGFIIGRILDIRKAKKEGIKIVLKKHISDKNIKSLIKLSEKKLLRKTKDAYIVEENGKPKIVGEVAGQDVDYEKAKSSLRFDIRDKWTNNSIVCKIPIKKTAPKVTKKILSELKDKMGTFTTNYGQYDTNRSNNIVNGTKHISNTLVKPGETFSVYKAVAPFSYENGYLTAGAYESGKIVQSYGGGICQVSTTLYNAVIRAELEIVERNNHSMTVHYVPLSFDATISGSDQDFKFKNDGDYPIYIVGKAGGGSVTFTIYGKDTRDKNRTIKFESRTLSTRYPGKKVVGKDSDMKKGKEKVEFPGSIGHTAEMWKYIYINGKLKKSYRFNYSVYSAAPKRVIVGTKKDDKDKDKKDKKDKDKKNKNKKTNSKTDKKSKSKK